MIPNEYNKKYRFCTSLFFGSLFHIISTGYPLKCNEYFKITGESSNKAKFEFSGSIPCFKAIYKLF